jgi:hypothetical protein
LFFNSPAQVWDDVCIQRASICYPVCESALLHAPRPREAAQAGDKA